MRKIVYFPCDDQRWFWTPEWQEKERQVDRDIAEGRVETFDTMEDFLSSLYERAEGNE